MTSQPQKKYAKPGSQEYRTWLVQNLRKERKKKREEDQS
jgi:hypothetical protein